MQSLKSVLLLISLLYLSLYLPLAFMIYTPLWYNINYEIQDTTNYISQTSLDATTSNLIGYFWHKEKLKDSFWSSKEQLHYQDVRAIYDLILVLALLFVLLLYFFWDIKKLKKVSKKLIIVPYILLILIPIFSLFWTGIFHPFLFSNDYWITSPGELSFLLFSNMFFLRSLIAMIIISSLINYGIYKGLTLSSS